MISRIGNEAPKDLNNDGDDLKDVAVHALKDLVESAIRDPKIKEAWKNNLRRFFHVSFVKEDLNALVI